MSYIVRHAGLALAAAIALSPATAFGWVETQIRSYSATVDVEAEGKALVAHELVMSVRGGPLKRFELPGVDADAEPLPDATVTPTVQGAASLPLLVERRDDGVLLLEVDHEKGIRSGRYSFAFRYRTSLLGRGLIQTRGSYAELRWISPRFEQGIDSMRVLFRLPPTSTPPALPSYDPSDTEAPFGAFIANLRRTPDKDELDIVRPHVAEGEPVVWRAHVSSTFAPPAESTAPTSRPEPVVLRTTAAVAQRLEWWGVCAAIAFLYGLLVWLKWRAFDSACESAQAKACALVPLPVSLRAPLSGLSLAAAVALALPMAQPTGAGFLLLLALALAALRAPLLRPTLRGPGQWLPLQEHEAFAKLVVRRPGRLLDGSTLPGFALFSAGLALSVGAAAWLLARSPYEALLALLAGSVLLPLFSTGRSVDLPAHALSYNRLLAKLAERLKRRPATRVLPWARVGAASGEPDELRLLVQPKPCPPGLVALELGVECVRGLGGSLASPYVLIRLKEGAELQRRLPREAVWTRGRKADERVAILRPALPTLRSCLALALSLLELIEQGASGPQGRSTARSSGSSERTAKLGRVPSPAHAM